MKKGISPVIASIILILIVLSLAGAYSVFTGRVAGTQVEAGQQRSQELTQALATNFKIENVEERDIILRNIGTETIKRNSVAVLIDDTSLNYTMNEDIAPRATGRLTLQGLWRVGPGTRTLRVQGAAYSDTMIIEIEPNDGAVLDMRFDEGSGTTAYDSSGNNNNGALNPNETAGPRWVEGRFGKALNFDGLQNYVEIANNTFNSLYRGANSEATISAWLKTSESTHSYPVSVEATWLLRIAEGDGGRPSVTFTGDSADRLIAKSRIDDEKWHHIIGVIDRGTAKIFVDGTLENSSSQTVYDIASYNSASRIGCNAYYTPEARWCLSGTIDEVSIYNRAYAPDELYVMRPA